jgi:hypothetical protein
MGTTGGTTGEKAMTEDRRTKAQILDELANAQKTIGDLEKRIPAPLNVVPAASALAGCIRALDTIPASRSRNSYDSNPGPDAREVTHVLQHLIARYGVDLTERVVEPCARVHLDDAPDAVVIDRLRGRF